MIINLLFIPSHFSVLQIIRFPHFSPLQTCMLVRGCVCVWVFYNKCQDYDFPFCSSSDVDGFFKKIIKSDPFVNDIRTRALFWFILLIHISLWITSRTQTMPDIKKLFKSVVFIQAVLLEFAPRGSLKTRENIKLLKLPRQSLTVNATSSFFCRISSTRHCVINSRFYWIFFGLPFALKKVN